VERKCGKEEEKMIKRNGTSLGTSRRDGWRHKLNDQKHSAPGGERVRVREGNINNNDECN